MNRPAGLLVCVTLCLAAQPAHATDLLLRGRLAKVNRCLHGRVLDFTSNHGCDRRIWSAALCEKRDLYVYLPPGFDPSRKYPLGMFLHGAAHDEQFFLTHLAKDFDAAIVSGKLPPFIVVAPDGSMLGRPSLFRIATFFANTRVGRYEDYLMQDIWDFTMRNFPLHPEAEAHVVLGASMGGAAAFNVAFKHPHKFKSALGFMPALNMRWVDCHGNYNSSFDPDCWGWRERLRPLEIAGRPKGVFKVRFHKLIGPLVGHGPDAMTKLSLFNPAEVMENYNVRPGQLNLFIAYGGKDEFNIPAQVESFLYLAHQRGLKIAVEYDPNGRHDEETGRRFFNEAIDWIAPLMEKYR